MTMFKPNLQIRNIAILDGARLVYSARFHEGVNIISGQNASGKTTILDFIFYALGGEGVPWKDKALLCTDVLLQLSINGAPLTVRRVVNSDARNPMSIYWGELDKATTAKYTDWESYPYLRSSSKESFSQVLFRLLELPEIKGEGVSNITMHQLLRLIYVDQRTPHDQIFRAEGFDTTLTRETVGNFLCGIYSDKLYDAQIELKDVDAKLGRSVSDLRSLFALLGKTGQGGANTTDFLRAEAASVTEEIKNLNSTLLRLRAEKPTAASGKFKAAETVSRLREKLTTLQKSYSETVTSISELEYEISDSDNFVKELERRIDSLEDSEETRRYLGSVKFNFCPCCLSKIDDALDEGTCSLCKTGDQKTAGDSQLLRMRNELAIQRKESVKLLDSRRLKLETLRDALPALKIDLSKSEAAYRAATAEWIPPLQREVDEINVKLGGLNQKLVQIGEYHKLATVIEGLQAQRTALETRKSELLDLITIIQSSNEESKSNIWKIISEQLIHLLRQDLPRQAEFMEAENVHWSFGENRVSVNGHVQFSESSMVVLKHCFHLSLLAASAISEDLRYPRLLILDGIEDGGQEIERSHALQRLIVRLSESLPSSHQIIFATSQIAPDLATTSLVAGNASTMENKTLKLN